MSDQLICPMCEHDEAEPIGLIDGHRFFTCSRCALAFTPQRFIETERIYDSGSQDAERGAPQSGWASPDFLAPAFDWLGEGSFRAMDFGCGESVVPDALRRRGHRVICVDLAPPVEPHPDRLTGDLLELHLEADQFDLAYSYQVFEHLAEPRLFFEEMLRVTRPGGVVMIHTDMEMPERENGLAHWWYVEPPVHCTFYRHQTFERVLAGRSHRIVHRGPKHVLIEVGEES